jgi:hypothetical protein
MEAGIRGTDIVVIAEACMFVTNYKFKNKIPNLEMDKCEAGVMVVVNREDAEAR